MASQAESRSVSTKAGDKKAEKQSISVDLTSPINVTVTGELQVKSVEQQSGRQEHALGNPEWWLVIATAVLVLVTAGLVRFTKKLWESTKNLALEAKATSDRQAKEMQESLTIAKTAASAAKESSDVATKAFIATHRPKIIVRRVALSENNEIFYSATNTGSSNAKITGVTAILWLPEAHENLPAIPPYANLLPQDIELKGGESRNFRLVVDPAILREHHLGVGFFQVAKGRPNTDPNATEPPLLFLGYIVYEDAMGQRHETGFLRRYDYITSRFNPVDHPDYEYQD